MTARSTIKATASTIIAACAVTLLLCQRYFGFMVIIEILILLPWILWSIWVYVRSPQQRSLLWFKFGVWLSSLAIVIGINFSVAANTRAEAQKIVNAVNAYYITNGSYPEDIQSIGYTKDDLHSLLGPSGYYYESGQPAFFYKSTYVPFGSEYYDFDKHEWMFFD